MSKQPKKSEPKAAASEAKTKPAKKPLAEAASSTTKPSTKTPAPKKPVPKSDGKPQRPNLLVGGIDTNLAASAAANMLVARRRGRDQVASGGSVDQIKSDLAKAPAAVAGEVLDTHAGSSGAKRPNLPGGPSKHNQTIGNAAERTFVPRRTAG